jgi:acyl carrier protein phosphodiesterase
VNFLAHLLLSGPDPELRTGGFLGDFVRGPLRGLRPARIEAGIALHRHVDARTDRDPRLRAAVRRLDPALRRFAPIALDVLFDHFLARDFAHWADRPLDDFVAEVHGQLAARRGALDPAARRFLGRMRRHELLRAYRRRGTVGAALARIAARSPRLAPLAALDEALAPHEDALAEDFARFFPELQQRCLAWRREHLGPEAA